VQVVVPVGEGAPLMNQLLPLSATIRP